MHYPNCLNREMVSLNQKCSWRCTHLKLPTCKVLSALPQGGISQVLWVGIAMHELGIKHYQCFNFIARIVKSAMYPFGFAAV